MKITSTLKASVVCVFLILVGLAVAIVRVTDWILAVPQIIFYVAIVINTFFSIKLFARLTPRESVLQNCLDYILVMFYIIMAYFLQTPILFIFFTLLLFIIASAKYTLLLNVINHPKLLRRKIIVDISGIFACALTLGGTLAGYVLSSQWIFTVAFIIANILLFSVWPLYAEDRQGGLPL